MKRLDLPGPAHGSAMRNLGAFAALWRSLAIAGPAAAQTVTDGFQEHERERAAAS